VRGGFGFFGVFFLAPCKRKSSEREGVRERGRERGRGWGREEEPVCCMYVCMQARVHECLYTCERHHHAHQPLLRAHTHTYRPCWMRGVDSFHAWHIHALARSPSSLHNNHKRSGSLRSKMCEDPCVNANWVLRLQLLFRYVRMYNSHTHEIQDRRSHPHSKRMDVSVSV
jgi:hypothetical protein